MELRVLEYFLAVAREQSILGAAESLHLSQPTLSRQLKDLETELGKQLFLRGNRKITLTEEGMILRKRAEEILDLVRKTEDEVACSDDAVSGEIYIGAAETDAIHLIARTAKQLRNEYPQLRFRISSGDACDVLELLDKGLIDFGVLFEPLSLEKYNHLTLPVRDTWGVLMRRDSPLAAKESVSPEDLWGKPLILSRQYKDGSDLSLWLGRNLSDLNVAATYSLIYNGSILVDEGIGYALCLDHVINTCGNSHICFRPLSPKLEIGSQLIWKRYQVHSRAAQLFLDRLQESLQSPINPSLTARGLHSVPQ